jgi:hypothetical protein
MNPGEKIISVSSGATYTLNKREKERTKSSMKVMYHFGCDSPDTPNFSMPEKELLLLMDRGVFKDV